MNSPELNNLLDLIGSKEAPKGYGQIYSGAKGVSLSTDVSRMTLDEVLAFQKRMLNGGSASTACGRYQFLRKTLLATISQMGLTGKEVWNRELQDRMAVHLMKGRKLDDYMAGRISAETFANNLAKEWASLPVVTAVRGSQGFVLKPGQSYYAGDGLNKAHHSPEIVLAFVRAVRKPAAPPAPVPLPPDIPAPEPQPPATAQPEPAKKGWWAWLRGLFS